MQRELNSISPWVVLWELHLSIPKCQHLHLGRADVPILSIHDSSENTFPIPAAEQVRDLEVLFDASLNSSARCDAVV